MTNIYVQLWNQGTQGIFVPLLHLFRIKKKKLVQLLNM